MKLFAKSKTNYFLVVEGEEHVKIPLLKQHTYMFGHDISGSLSVSREGLEDPIAVLYEETGQWILSLLVDDSAIISKGSKTTSVRMQAEMDVSLAGVKIRLIEQLPGHKEESLEQPGNKKVIVLSLVLAAIVLWAVLGGGQKQTSPEKDERVGLSEPTKDGLPAQDSELKLLPEVSRPIFSAEVSGGEEYRLALSYYDAGNLAMALDYLEKSLLANPNNHVVMKKFLELETDFDKKATSHYQNGCDHARYMRDYEAQADFRVILSLLRNEKDERYIDAKRMLDLLGGGDARVLCKTAE